MSLSERVFRGVLVALLTVGLIVAVYGDKTGWAALFGLLLGTALERLTPPQS